MSSNRSGFDRGGSVNTVGTGISKNAANSALGGTLLSLKPTAKYLSGARAILKINNTIMAFAFQISWSTRTEQTEILTIDDYLPYELAPRRITVSGQIGGFVLPGQSLTSQVIQPDALSFLFDKYIAIHVSDSITGQTIFQTDRAVVTGSNTSVSPEGYATTTLEWQAIGWKAEAALEFPQNYDKPATNGGSFGYNDGFIP